MTTASALAKPAQLRMARRSPAYWRITIDNPPINVMGPEMVREFQEVIGTLEADEACQGRGLRQRGRRLLFESLRFHREDRGSDFNAARPHRIAALAGLSRNA